MGVFKKWLWGEVAFCCFKMCLLGGILDFPKETPGLQSAMGQPPTNPFLDCRHIIVPGTNCHLYFPISGAQPNPANANDWSGANYIGQCNDDEVTDWWVRIFGGNQAVEFSRDGIDSYFAPKMGFKGRKTTHIICLDKTSVKTPADFERKFWQKFRNIAANPVGRVLLYHLLIEIRNVYNTKDECYKIKIGKLRSMKVCYRPSSPNYQASQKTLKIEHGWLTASEENDEDDVTFFYQLLCWYNYLRCYLV